MSVLLTPELEQLVEAQVKSGRYGSANEVLAEAIRLWEQRYETLSPGERARFRRQSGEGWDQAQNGEVVDGDIVFGLADDDLAVIEGSRGGE